MKKLLSIFGTLCALLLMSTLFAACGGDDNGEKEKDDKPQTTTLKIKVNPSADFLELATVKLTYTDENGKAVETNISGNTTKTVTHKGYPFQTSYTISVEYKNPTLTKDTYSFSLGDGYSVETAAGIKSNSISVTSEVEKANVKAYFDKLSSYKMTVTVDNDGVTTVKKTD